MIRFELLHTIQESLKVAAKEVVADDNIWIMTLDGRKERVEQRSLRLDGLEGGWICSGPGLEIWRELFYRPDDCVEGRRQAVRRGGIVDIT